LSLVDGLCFWGFMGFGVCRFFSARLVFFEGLFDCVVTGLGPQRVCLVVMSWFSRFGGSGLLGFWAPQGLPPLNIPDA